MVYQLGNTSSRMLTEVKQCGTRLLQGWETVQVLSEYCGSTLTRIDLINPPILVIDSV